MKLKVGDIVKLRGLRETTMRFEVVGHPDNHYVTIKETTVENAAVQLQDRNNLIKC